MAGRNFPPLLWRFLFDRADLLSALFLPVDREDA